MNEFVQQLANAEYALQSALEIMSLMELSDQGDFRNVSVALQMVSDILTIGVDEEIWQ